MSSAAAEMFPRYRFTTRDYHRMGDAGILHEDSRVELIEGEIVTMPPIGSEHVGTVLQLSGTLQSAVGARALVSVQNPLVLDDYSEPEPDIVLLKPRADFYKSALPRPEDVLLLVEVADTTLRYDREVKIPLYGRNGVPEVWLVDLQKQQVTIFSSPSAQGYQEENVPDTLAGLSPRSLPDIVLDLSGLF
jgi:Uma2 family endonuclease